MSRTERRSDLRPVKFPGRGLALVVGINDYAAPLQRLHTAAGDAGLVAEVLRLQHGYQVTTLCDEQATKQGILAALDALVAEWRKDDRLLFYFAGHGVAVSVEDTAEGDPAGAAALAGPRGFFLPRDAVEQRVDTYLPMSDVLRRLERLEGGHLLMVLDCCFAGAFRWSNTRATSYARAREELFEERYQMYHRFPARQVITSAAHDEKAADAMAPEAWSAGAGSGTRGEHEGHSPFAFALLEALREGKADLTIGGESGDRVMTAAEIHHYISQRIRKLGGRWQTPMFWSFGDPRYVKGQYVFHAPGGPPMLVPAPELSDENNPYPGLKPYGENPGNPWELFCGREGPMEELRACVEQAPLTVVVGPSGSGKSSLVKAGLMPRLRGEEPAWRILGPVRPQDLPAEAAGAELGRQLLASLQVESKPSVASLAEGIGRWREACPGERLLVVVDQLEELVTTQREAAVDRLLAELRGALAAAPGAVRVVLTLRSDFEPHFAGKLGQERRYAKPDPSLREGDSSGAWFARFFVRAMRHHELRQVIEEPAAALVMSFDPEGLVESIVDEVVETPGALPLLCFTLKEMYRSYVRRTAGQGAAEKDRTIRREDYEAVGGEDGIAGVLRRRLDAVDDELRLRHGDPGGDTTMLRLMLRLTTQKSGEPARRRVERGELDCGEEEEDRRVAALCERLVVQERLLTVDSRAGETYVEPAHDKVILGWPRLLRSLEQGQAAQLLIREMGDAAAKWRKNGRRAEHLYRDSSLARLARERREFPYRFNRWEREYLRRSLRARLIGRVTAVAVVLAVMVGLGGAALYARKMQSKAEEGLRKEKGLRAWQLTEQPGRRVAALVTAVEAALPDLEARRGVPLEVQAGLYQAVRRMAPSRELAGHSERARSVAFSADGTRVVTTAGQVARIWDAGTGKPLQSLEGHADAVWRAAFSTDGGRVVTASSDKTARIWDARTGSALRILAGHEDQVVSAAFSADGMRVVTSGFDRTARIWDAGGGGHLLTLAGHLATVGTAAFQADGGRVVTASDDQTARIWDARGGELLLTLEGHTNWVRSAGFSADGSRVVTASMDDTARIWDARSGTSLLILMGHAGDVESAAFSADGSRVVTASYDGTACVWDARTGRALLSLEGHTGEVGSAAFSPAGGSVATTSDDGTVRIWDTRMETSSLVLAGHDRSVESVALSAEGNRIVTAGHDRTARIWDARTGGSLLILRGHKAGLLTAAFSLDGSRVVTAGLDGAARVWDARAGTSLLTIEGRLRSAAFSADGSRVVAASGNEQALIHDARSGELLLRLEGHTSFVQAAAFSADGGRVVTASSDKTARIWDARTGRSLWTLEGHTEKLWSAAFSTDGGRVVTASGDKTARIWDAQAGRDLLILEGHTAPVSSARFSEDGSRVVTASDDGTVRIWDPDTGASFPILAGHGGRVRSAAFSADGSRVVTAGVDGTARVHLVSPGSLLPLACRLLQPQRPVQGITLAQLDRIRAACKDRIAVAD